MPVDPSIPLQFRLPQLQGPLEQASQVAQLQHLFDQSALSKLNREKMLRGQQQEDEFRSGVAGLGDAPTQEALVQLAARFGSPDKVLTTHQASMDRKEAIAARDRAAQAQLDQRNQNEQMMHEFRMSRLSNEADRATEMARHNKASEAIQAQLADLRGAALTQGKTPSGYRATADGNLEAIKGGPADLKQQGVLNQDTSSLQGTTASMDRLAVAANELMKHPGLSRITGITGAFPDVPGSAAANARAKLQTLKAQTGFSVLQDMRNASKTGGALGSITEKELSFLQNALAALETSQSEAEIKKSLEKIVEFTEASKGRLRDAYNMRHGDKAQTPTQPAPAQPATPGAVREFATEAEAAAAGLQDGARVKIGGKSGTWRAR